ncbi:RDD family protein [Actinoplanes sp. CA-030573]|uniref:RDD family protein n=1 Tax=Actinoplanes sp. CA-030573 TaxID=3239898 RepID=UPI003D90DF37
MTLPHGENSQQAHPYAPPPAPAYALQPIPNAPVYPQHPYPQHPYPQHPYPQRQERLVSPGGRLGARLLDGVLAIVTLGIGFLIWSFFTWPDGQTPAKKMLGHVVVDANTGQPFDLGRMIMRQILIEGLLGTILSSVTCSIYLWVDGFMVFGERNRTLHDRMAGSVVVYQ